MLGVTIRASHSEDFADVFRLLQELWPSKMLDQAVLREVFEKSICDLKQYAFCALMDDQIAAFMATEIINDYFRGG